MKTSDLKILPWRIVAFCLVALSFACCTVVPDYVAEVECDGVDEIAATEGSIPVEEALGALNRTLAVIDGPTRNCTRVAQHICALTKRDMFGISSRASLVRGEDDDNLVYVVNFADDSGFAILNARSYSPDTVLIVGDTGCYDPALLSANISRSGDDVDEEGYQVPDSLKIKFADLYCEEDDDFYIGNIQTGPNYEIIKPLLFKYMTEDDLIADLGGNGPGDGGGVNPGGGSGSGGGNTGSGTGGSGSVTDEFSPNTFVPVLLNTMWGQDVPFNNKIHLAPDGSGHRPAGCTTIAAAQILANIKTIPPSKIAPDITSTWERFELVEPGITTPNADSLAVIIKAMADGIGVKYNFLGSDQTFATPQKVKNYLESIGCSVSKYHSLNNSVEGKIQSSISSGKPVFIAALDHDAVKRGGHAWVFDGYGKRPSDQHCYLHCNYGWDGKSNGWYYYKLFKRSSDKKELDEGVGDISSYFNYDWWYRVLIIK